MTSTEPRKLDHMLQWARMLLPRRFHCWQQFQQESDKILLLKHYFLRSETSTWRKIEMKYLKSFETWCWRRIENMKWTFKVSNEDILRIVIDERLILTTILFIKTTESNIPLEEIVYHTMVDKFSNSQEVWEWPLSCRTCGRVSLYDEFRVFLMANTAFKYFIVRIIRNIITHPVEATRPCCP